MKSMEKLSLIHDNFDQEAEWRKLINHVIRNWLEWINKNKHLKLQKKQNRKVIIAAKSLIGSQMLKFKKGFTPEKTSILARNAKNFSINSVV